MQVVDGPVQLVDLLLLQRTPPDDEAVEVEEVALAFGESRHRRRTLRGPHIRHDNLERTACVPFT